MRRGRAMWVMAVSLGLVALAWIGLRQASLRVLDEPGRAETYLATKAKRFLVGREARHIRRRQPVDLSRSVTIGQMQFRGRCASWHGLNGRTATDMGSAMYPRASDLGSSEVQKWADAELFWIVQNGIRLTGMPGFGRSLSEEEIWPLVDYIRSLGANSMGKTEDVEEQRVAGTRKVKTQGGSEMKKNGTYALAVAVALVLLVGVAAAQKETTIESTLVDSKCYLSDKSLTGNDHGAVKQCGTLCLKGGTPAGLLAKDKKFHAVIAPATVLADHVGQPVRVSGTLHNGSLLAKKVEINMNGKWEEVELK